MVSADGVVALKLSLLWTTAAGVCQVRNLMRAVCTVVVYNI